MQLGDADRELLYETLKRHHAEGRLDLDELERRVTLVAEAHTRDPAPPPERRPRWGRGHGEAEKPAPDWQPTNERFRDPRTKSVMRVWVDAAGARHYVAES